jgi:hypothetical protein
VRIDADDRASSPSRDWKRCGAAQALIVTVRCLLPLTFEQSSLTGSVAVIAESTDSPVLAHVVINATVNLIGSITMDAIGGLGSTPACSRVALATCNSCCGPRYGNSSSGA